MQTYLNDTGVPLSVAVYLYGPFWGTAIQITDVIPEEIVISRMAYVDLNPVRANIATTPEASAQPCFKERIAPTGRSDHSTARSTMSAVF